MSNPLGLLRKGMWVMTPQGVGILTSMPWAHSDKFPTGQLDDNGEPIKVLPPMDKALVDLVNDRGFTWFANVQLNPAELRQATFEEIPGARRPEPEAGALLGYC